MKKVILSLMVIVTLIAGLAIAASRATPDQAKANMEKAVAYFTANGKDKSLATFSDPKSEFVKDDLYIVVLSQSGDVLAHGRNKAIIGKNMMGVPDVDGKLFTKLMVESANGKTQSVEYKFTNPETKKTEPKISFYQKAGDVVVLCGAYKQP